MKVRLMSLAKKCNRCHVCFDPYNIQGRMARFVNPIFQTSDDIREQYRGKLLDEDVGVDGIIDLCPACAVAFREFMNCKENPDNLPSNQDLTLQEKVQQLGRFLSDQFRSITQQK